MIQYVFVCFSSGTNEILIVDKAEVYIDFGKIKVGLESKVTSVYAIVLLFMHLFSI